MRRSALLATALTVLASGASARGGDLLAPKGARGVLTVEYSFTSSGKTGDQNDTRQWSVQRIANVRAEMVAQAPQPVSSMNEMNAGEKADLESKQAHVKSAQEKMAPMQADIQKIMEKCGEDQACMEREIQKYGMANSNSETMKSAQSARGDVAAASAQGPAHYQMWKAASQSGTFSIAETRHDVLADPACGKSLHCVTDVTAKGGGDIPAAPGTKTGAPAAFAFAEIDSTGKTLTLALPVPISLLPFSKTVQSNSPGTKNGTFQEQVRFPGMDLKPIRVPLKGDGRDQSGTETIPVPGAGGDGGTLTVRWKFTAK